MRVLIGYALGCTAKRRITDRPGLFEIKLPVQQFFFVKQLYFVIRYKELSKYTGGSNAEPF